MEVTVFINRATDTSIPLEVASKIANGVGNVDVTVYSFFEPDETSFACDVRSLDATSQLDVNAYRRLFGMLRKQQPDVFHVHPNATGSIARILATFTGVGSIITTEHSVHTEFGIARNLVNGSTNWLNDVLVCNSTVTEKSLSRWEETLLRITGTETRVIYNGADLDVIEATTGEREGLPDGFLIGTVGRLIPEKNQASIIHAVSSLVDEGPDVHAVIVGGGPLRADLEALAREEGVEDNVHFLGFIPREEVFKVLRSLDVFVFPSLYEGFGVAVAEAMATGTPVVANDIEVLREVVGDAGHFVDATDSSELTSAIKTLYGDDDTRLNAGREAKQRIERTFTLEKTAESYSTLYQSTGMSADLDTV